VAKILTYKDGNVTETNTFASFSRKPVSGLVWIDFERPTEDELNRLALILELHPVAREELSRASNRPKLNDYGEYISMTIHVPGGKLNEPHSHEIDIVVGKNWIVTAHSQKIKGLRLAWELCQNDYEKMSNGSDFLLAEILQTLFERFIGLMEWMDRGIDRLEEDILEENATEKTLRRIAQLRTAVSGIRRTLLPEKEILFRLARKGVCIIDKDKYVYFNDLHETFLRRIDEVERFRDTLTHLMELYMSRVSRRMNQIMKILTIWSTIFLPLTFLTGLWGMNFKYMPELSTPWGYWASLGLMALVAVIMIIFFRRKKWL